MKKQSLEIAEKIGYPEIIKHPLHKLGFSLGWHNNKIIYKHPTIRLEKLNKILKHESYSHK